jgi:hypothetical protein
MTPVRVDPVRPGQSGFKLGQSILPLAKQLFPRFAQKSFKRRTEHEHQAIQLMVDGRDKVEKCELQIRAGKVIEGQGRQPLELAREVITQVADRAAEKWRNIGGTSDLLTVQEVS